MLLTLFVSALLVLLSVMLMVTTEQLNQANADLATLKTAYDAALANAVSNEDAGLIETLVTNLRADAAPLDPPTAG